MSLHLASVQPFAQGGNRLCFVHPRDPARCIKIRRPDFTLEDLRRKKGFPKNLKPLSSFDDNREEAKVIAKLEKRYGAAIFRHVSRCFGFEQTDLGLGLTSELIRDADGRISATLKKFLWDNGLTPGCRRAAAELSHFWETHAVPSRDLLLHNLLVQCDNDGSVRRLVVIDGLGSSSLVPVELLPATLRRAKSRRKTVNLQERMGALLALRDTGVFPGQRGLLIHDGTGLLQEATGASRTASARKSW